MFKSQFLWIGSFYILSIINMEKINTFDTYKFSIWLFDKDQKKQLISTEKAKTIIKKLTLKFFWFWSITDWNGIYTHENGESVQEPTVFVSVSLQNYTQKAIREYVENLKKQLNQESIMVSKSVDLVNFW